MAKTKLIKDSLNKDSKSIDLFLDNPNISDLINIRNYVRMSVDNPSTKREDLNKLSNLLLKLDNKIVKLLLDSNFNDSL